MATRSTTSEKILIELEAKTAIFEKRMDESAKLLKRVERNTKSASNSMAGMNKAIKLASTAFKGLIGAEVVRRMSSFAKSALDSADIIGKTANTLGLGTEAYQQYAHQAELAGIATGQFNSNMTAFVKRVGEAKAGVGPLVSGLKNLNPELLKQIQNSKNQGEALETVLQAMRDTTSATEKAAIANAAFSRSGVAMSRMAENTAPKIATISGEMAEAATSINDKWTIMSANIANKFKEATISLINSAMKLFGAVNTLGDVQARIIELENKLLEPRSETGRSGRAARERIKNIEDELAALRSQEQALINTRRAYDELNGTQALSGKALEVPDSGKGAASRAKELEKAGDAMVERWRANMEEIQQISDSIHPTEPLLREIEHLQNLMNLYPDKADVLFERIAQVHDEIDNVMKKGTEIAEEKTKQLDAMAVAIGNSLKDFASGIADSLVNFATTGEQSFAEMTRSILANLAKMILQMQILKALGATPWGAALGFSTGGAAKGATGLAGGAARGVPSGLSSGAGLPANVAGRTPGLAIAGGTNVTVNNNMPGAEVQVQEQPNGAGGNDIVLYIEQTIANYFDSGGGDSLMQATYGGRRIQR